MRPSSSSVRVASLLTLLAAVLVAPHRSSADGLAADGRAGVVSSLQGVSFVRPVGRERWSPLDAKSLVLPGDIVRTQARGANALELRLVSGARVVVGPGAVLEFPDAGGLRVLRGDVEVAPRADQPLHVTGPAAFEQDVAGTTWLRANDSGVTRLTAAPRWLEGYRASTSEEWMGSLLATVDGKNVPLHVGYHKVTVEIRDQIARTTVEESFVNTTLGTLEGVFSFPLPADASISGFGMWIGDELVEADLVEKQKARAIYEDILRRRKDPGLLEWEGGNLFKARVFPIFPHAEKRIRLRYTQVLPLEGDSYRYRYALRSELLRTNPLRELSMSVSVVSTAAIGSVTSPTHPVTVRATEHEAVAEFGAQQYVPERDFELAVKTGRGDGVSAIAHRRGEDGFFMLLLAPPDGGAGWQRDLVPEGSPLDLVLVADTSGSMDEASRATQAAFLAGLLGQLSAKDRFRLLACDVEPVWLVAEPTAVTPDAVEQALAALERRFSLGWTDLDRAVDAALPALGAGSQVIYVGDGIATSGDGDAVALADRIRRKGAGAKGAFHAVSTSSAYEKGVLDAIASVGGGSVRRAESGPVEAAKALLGEIARPGLRDARVEIRGVPTAKVYPEVLPNLPLTEQQVVLGRFLPGGDVKSAEVVVTGTVAGKPVRYTATLRLPEAEEGNSFLPRLWARRHLDALLAQGANPQTKEEIVAFSREYEIMTPYTSFLVLENDEDRQRYGVERTVHMRDAERFFAQARDRATLEIARGQMVTARRWRLGWRRAALAEIAALGRDLPVPTEVAWGAWGSDGRDLVGVGGSAGVRFEGKAGAKRSGSREPSDPAPPSSPRPSLAPKPQADHAESGDDRPAEESLSDTDAEDTESVDEGEGDEKENARKELAKSDDSRRARRARETSAEGFNFIGPANGLFAGSRPASTRDYGAKDAYAASRFASFDPSMLGFPGLEPSPNPPTGEPPQPPAWDAAVLEALRSLDRRPSLQTFAGVLKVTSTQESVHALQGTVTWRARSTTLASQRRWLRTTSGARSLPTTAWLSETERVVLDDARRLGRRRPAGELDRGHWPLPLSDHSMEDYVAALAASWRPPTSTREGELLRLAFASQQDPSIELRLAIDTTKHVLVEASHVVRGRATSTVRYADFVAVAGRFVATRVEHLDEERHVVSRTSLAIEAVEPSALDAALDAASKASEDGVFLGASEPTLLAAQQAVRDGRAALPDLLVVAMAHGSAGRFDDLEKAWSAVEAAVGDKPARAWMRLVVLARGRRLDSAAALASTMATGIGADATSLAPARAAILADLASPFGPTERLGVVEALLPAFSRGADADLEAAAGRRRVADAVAATRDTERAIGLYESLATDRPGDVEAVIAYAQALRTGEDLEGAARVVAHATKAGPWTRAESERLHQAWIGWLWESRDVPALDEVVAAWVAASPTDPAAYRVAMSLGYFRGRSEAVEKDLVATLSSELSETADSAARARRSATVMIALGQGWNFWARVVAEPFRAPLADLALRAARGDVAHLAIAQQILGDWRFRSLEEARALVEALRTDLTSPGAIAAMPVERLAFLLQHALPGASDAARAAVVDALRARWRATPIWADAERVSALLLQAIPSGGRNEERLAFLRERLGRASGADTADAARAVLHALTSAPYEPAREDEAFALLARIVGPDSDPAASASARAAAATRLLAAWMSEGRQRAALGAPAEGTTWTRTQVAQRTKESRTQARTEIVARFAAAVATAGPRMRNWLEVERLGYAAELGNDLPRIEGEARELLQAVPATSTEPIDRLLAERAIVVLEYAATRRAAPAGLADRVVALLRARLAAKDALLDAEEHLVRVLVALDRTDELKTTLASLIRESDVDVRWAQALAFVLAETGDLRGAATTLETAAARGDLDAGAWTSLGGWYLVLKEDARRDAALDRALAMQPEWQVQQRIWQALSRVQRRGDGVPEELDPEALRALRFLLTKAERPAQFVGQVTALYRATKDFRVLEALADGVPGHSAEGVYAYLEASAAVVADVHEEATCDALTARLTTVLATARNDVDRRAIRLLLTAVESRAAAVPKADPAHGTRAIEALQAASEGPLVSGERALLARRLASLDPAAPTGLPEAQLEQLERLFASSQGDVERVQVGHSLARALWTRGRKDAAVERLDAVLAAARESGATTLRPELADAHQALVAWWVELGRFRVAEARLVGDIARERRSQRRDALRLRLADVYRAALERGGATAMGSGVELFEGASRLSESYLATGPGYQLDDWAQKHADLFQTAHKAAVTRDVGERLESFVRERLPATLERDPTQASQVIGPIWRALHDVKSPLAALHAALDRVDREPRWFERVGWDVWAQTSNWLAGWRREADAAGGLGDLEHRLLAFVVDHLERDLRAGQHSNYGFWWRNSGDFWTTHATDFARVAAKVAEVNAGEPAIALHVAQYQRGGLGLRAESIATLSMSIAQGKDPENLRSTLASWLHDDHRDVEAWPVVKRLVVEATTNVAYHLLAARVLHGVGKDADALALLQAAATRWKATKTWNEGIASQFATVSLEIGEAGMAAAWIDEALTLRREHGGGAGPDATLSAWYSLLARARGALHDTDGAVRAAAAAIVAWGRDYGQRARALDALRRVLLDASDLDAWVTSYVASVAAAGLDAPTIRKALGQVYVERHRYDAAAAQLVVARELDPADAEVHAALLRSYDALGDGARALEALRASIRLAPRNVTVYGDLAGRYERAGDVANAERARTNLVEAMPAEAEGHRALARLRETAKRFDLAIERWRAVVRLRADEPAGWLSLAKAQVAAGDDDGARATLDHVLATSWDARFGDVKAEAAALRAGMR